MTRTRDEIPEEFTWNLSDIYPDWTAWEAGLAEFERMLPGYAELRGTLAQGPERLLKAFRLGDDLGQLSYRIWYYAGLTYDQDQRDNAANARRQKVQILFAKAAEARSWFTPELLRIPLATVRAWMSANPELAVYRFAIESTYHQQEHVLDEKGEHLLSLSSRFGDVPHDVHSMLANADIKHPVITLHDGKQVTLTYGQYNALLADQSPSTRSRGRVPRVSRDVCRQCEHVRGRLQRRAAARLVHRAGAPVQEHARGGASRQRHSTGGRREPRGDREGGNGAAAAVSPPAQARARPRDVPRVRPARPADRLRSEVRGTRR